MAEPSAHEPQPTKPPAPGLSRFSLDRAVQTLLQPIAARLAKLESLLTADQRRPDDAREETVPTARPEPLEAVGSPRIAAELCERLTGLETAIAELGQKFEALGDRIAAPPPANPAEFWQDFSRPDDAWPRIVLGDELCEDSLLEVHRREFLADVTGGQVTARALAGQLMSIQAASVDQLPELLRYVGEAYYRWRTDQVADDDPFENALVQWLNRLVATAGLPNSIQRVRRGERFDSTRHSASGRGNEVVGVHGWVVLRDHSRVYTKASVSVK